MTEPLAHWLLIWVLGESYPMNTNMTGFRWFSAICRLTWITSKVLHLLSSRLGVKSMIVLRHISMPLWISLIVLWPGVKSLSLAKQLKWSSICNDIQTWHPCRMSTIIVFPEWALSPEGVFYCSEQPPSAPKIHVEFKLTKLTLAVQYLSSRFTVLTMLGCHICFIIRIVSAIRSSFKSLSAGAQGHKDVWKSSKPCHVGIHWIALAKSLCPYALDESSLSIGRIIMAETIDYMNKAT